MDVEGELLLDSIPLEEGLEEFEEEFDEKRITYLFDGSFDSESTKDLIYFLNQNTQPLNLFISTPGGNLYCLHAVIEAIKGYGNDIVIYPVNHCSSCGFFLLLNTKTYIEFVDKSIVSIVHFPRIDSLMDFNKNNIYPKTLFNKKGHEVIFNEQLKELPLPKKTMNKLLKGEDVELFYEDLIEIFKDRLRGESE